MSWLAWTSARAPADNRSVGSLPSGRHGEQGASMSGSTTIRFDKGDDGIVVLTLDDPDQSANTMNAAYGESIRATVDRLEAERDDIKGVVITSAKKSFFVGGDLNDLKQVSPEDADEFARFVRENKAV